MQPTRGLHDQILVLWSMIAVDIMDNPIDFRAANTMLNTNPFAGNRLVFRPFVIGERALARFLLGLARRDARRFIALKARIFVYRLNSTTSAWSLTQRQIVH